MKSVARKKQSQEVIRKYRKSEGKRSEMEKVGIKKMQIRKKGREVAKHCLLPVFCGSGGSKNSLAKAAGAEASGQMKYEKLHTVVAPSTFKHVGLEALLEVEILKKCTPLWRQAHLEVKGGKIHRGRSVFGS